MDGVAFTAGSFCGAILMGMAILAVQFFADAILGYRAPKDSTAGQASELRHARISPCRSYGRFDESDF